MNRYNVFTDFHHAGLLHSLILLFEGRFGGKVYRPIGRKWHTLGYWKIYDHPATVAQYLDIGGATPDGTEPLNEVLKNDNELPGVYKCQDIDSGYFNRAITYEAFMKLPIDIIIASIPAHIEPFKELAGLHPNKPKVIYQIGNAWTVDAGLAPNIMASAVINNVPENINFISYHQEFSTEVFKPDFETPQWALIDYPGKNISSFVNVFNGAAHYAEDWQLFQEVEKAMPDWSFKSYGGQCRDGSKGGDKEVAKSIRESRFVWHTKAGGDGYGHIIHNVPACGRPLVVKKEYYRGKMAEPLLEDGISCITIDGLSPSEIIAKIEHFNEPDRYKALCQNAYFYFRKVVDFKLEAEQIGEFLKKLI